jgi:hypothetical protein
MGAKESGEISEFFNSKLPWDDICLFFNLWNNNREKKIIGNSIMISANTDLTQMESWNISWI